MGFPDAAHRHKPGGSGLARGYAGRPIAHSPRWRLPCDSRREGLTEVAQTARLRGQFRFYLVPVQADGLATYGLVAAFFDDPDEPLVIRTPLVNEEIPRGLVALLSSDSFYVHFFDEHNRELLGFRAENPNAHRFRAVSNTMRFTFLTLARARQVFDDLQVWFGARSPSDDATAFTIHLRERLFPDNLAEHVANPGDLNEPDIATALHRPFGGAHVFKNPIRADNGREFVDVLVATTKTLLLIQAKDSPNTESGLTRKIVRKRATAVKHVRKATAQLEGSINHLRSGQSIEIITEGKRRRVSMSGRDVFSLVIVKELFDPDRPDCSPPVLTVYGETGTPCLLLDHTEFQQLAFFRSNEESFVGTLGEIFAAARAEGVFPRSRFGLRTGKTVVYDPTATRNPPDPTTHEWVQVLTEGSHIIFPPISGDWITDEAAEMGSRKDLDADWLRVVVDRSDVEGLDVSRYGRNPCRVCSPTGIPSNGIGGAWIWPFSVTPTTRENYATSRRCSASAPSWTTHFPIGSISFPRTE